MFYKLHIHNGSRYNFKTRSSHVYISYHQFQFLNNFRMCFWQPGFFLSLSSEVVMYVTVVVVASAAAMANGITVVVVVVVTTALEVVVV